MRNRLGRPFLIAAGFLFAACSERGEVRDWRPADHSQPPGVQAGGARTATGTGAAAPSPEEARLRAGAAIFRSQCAVCHGEAGRGDGPSRSAGAAPPDFTSAEFHAARSDQALLTVIAGGRGAMPGFANQLGEAGLAAAVAHVRSLRPSPSPSQAPVGAPVEPAPVAAPVAAPVPTPAP